MTREHTGWNILKIFHNGELIQHLCLIADSLNIGRVIIEHVLSGVDIILKNTWGAHIV